VIQIDFEATNRCNASCYFCPRDMTPPQGLMSPEVFDKGLERTIEFRDGLFAREMPDQEIHVALCGLGEPLLNKHLPDFTKKLRDSGFYCSVSSNGALLDERRGRDLLEAGMSRIDLNVGDTGDEYEEVYKLPWEKTRDNVIRFAEMAKDYDCTVQVVIVLHRDSQNKAKKNAHGREIAKFWREHGITNFIPFNVMNRGGALNVDYMQYESYSEVDEARELFAQRGVEPVCMAPFVFQFIGYDGNYYLCCSDWTKKTPMGTVFERSLESVIEPKVEYVMDRRTVCDTCNFDPLNKMAEELRAFKRGDADQHDVDEVLDELAEMEGQRAILTKLGAVDKMAELEWAPREPSHERKLIPVTVSES
jgi:MoaA/NifB/PqqE/SkfB family radical SAM enzyme